MVSILLDHMLMEIWTTATTNNDLHKEWQQMCESTSGIYQFPNFQWEI